MAAVEQTNLVFSQQNSHIVITDSLLAEGINYKKKIVTINGLKHCVYVLQVDLTNPKTEIGLAKGGNSNIELARLPVMFANTFIDTLHKQIIGGINASFWRTYSNYPIGPTVIDGEVVEMQSFKRWTSIFFNKDGFPFMDFFTISGKIQTKNGKQININSVNRRRTNDGVVIYNKFSDYVIPTRIERVSKVGYGLKKIVVRYIDEPAINTVIRCEVIDIVNYGSVQKQENGCILSIGEDIDILLLPQIGDTIFLHYETNIYETEIFMNAICGTPRLVRNGIAKHEAYEEGNSHSRFINGSQLRSAVGYDKGKTNLFLVTVGICKGTTGASLTQLAAIMEYLGCYSALNLDGGSSTNMVIGGKNIMDGTTSRKLSVGLVVLSLQK